ncbi:conserved hypothetical protein [Beutenbergia cavernae DSM 12333]|uniref:Antibiotic biosynthesis monooxygenase n=1 Tax=Beutenbergia cavernae (strain ATCC BAA-8 / DSM 12333 / CCUG 43141 / JCM 11478 / NBRC 16432 / NCIMB 13614 / HKI 0122) TaxID=471853 RepID=C5C4C8_BEUC1|nr:hypothetical protein [Beutenbergia cavernae]ACQ82052.1 conserved hypothetical protein [Beutenbergia cavernae DSM 12333]
MIMRVWRGWVATERLPEYVAYIEETGVREYLETPGNRGAQMVTRDEPDGRTEILTLSWWDGMDAIRAFAGDDVEAAKYYPEDEGYLLAQEDRVRHYVVAAGADGAAVAG